VLYATSSEVDFQLIIQDGSRKTKSRTIFDGTLLTSCHFTVIARFCGMADSAVLISLLYKLLESIRKSNMAAAKPEILLSQRRDELPTKFQRLH